MYSNKKKLRSYKFTYSGCTVIIREDSRIDFFESSGTDGNKKTFIDLAHFFHYLIYEKQFFVSDSKWIYRKMNDDKDLGIYTIHEAYSLAKNAYHKAATADENEEEPSNDHDHDRDIYNDCKNDNEHFNEKMICSPVQKRFLECMEKMIITAWSDPSCPFLEPTILYFRRYGQYRHQLQYYFQVAEKKNPSETFGIWVNDTYLSRSKCPWFYDKLLQDRIVITDHLFDCIPYEKYIHPLARSQEFWDSDEEFNQSNFGKKIKKEEEKKQEIKKSANKSRRSKRERLVEDVPSLSSSSSSIEEVFEMIEDDSISRFDNFPNNNYHIYAYRSLVKFYSHVLSK